MTDSSDEEDDACRFLRPGAAFIVEDEDPSAQPAELELSFSEKLEIAVLLRDPETEASLSQLSSYPAESESAVVANLILSGRHCDLRGASASRPLLADLLARIVPSSTDRFNDSLTDSIQGSVADFIGAGLDASERESRACLCMLVGYLYLELFVQANYTGPELTPSMLQLIGYSAENIDQHSCAVALLTCDGECAFRHCVVPQCLVIARSVLATLSDPLLMLWGHGIELAEDGAVLPKRGPLAKAILTCKQVTSALRTRHWLSLRACVVHLRLLQRQSGDKVPTLWREAQALAEYVIQDFAPSSSSSSAAAAWLVRAVPDSKHRSLLAGQAWLERGLMLHHFERADKVLKIAVLVNIYVERKILSCLLPFHVHYLSIHLSISLCVYSGQSLLPERQGCYRARDASDGGPGQENKVSADLPRPIISLREVASRRRRYHCTRRRCCHRPSSSSCDVC